MVSPETEKSTSFFGTVGHLLVYFLKMLLKMPGRHPGGGMGECDGHSWKLTA